MGNAIETIIEFCLSEVEGKNLQTRAAIYRALADICGDELEHKNLIRMARDLENADSVCRQFMFSFSQKNKAEGGGR